MKKNCYGLLVLALLATSDAVAMHGGMFQGGPNSRPGTVRAETPEEASDATTRTLFSKDVGYATPKDLDELAKRFDNYLTREEFKHHSEIVSKILQALPEASTHPTRSEVTKQIADAHEKQLDSLNSSLANMLENVQKISGGYAEHQKKLTAQEAAIAALVRQQNNTDGVVVTLQAGLLALQQGSTVQNNNPEAEVAVLKEQLRDLQDKFKYLSGELVEQDGVLKEDLDNINSLNVLTAHHTELINALTARVQQLMPAGQQLERSAGSDSVVQDALQQASTVQNNNNPEYDALIQRLTALETLVAQLQQSKALVEAGQRGTGIGSGLVFPPLPTINTQKIVIGTGVVGAAVLVLYLKSHDMLPTKN